VKLSELLLRSPRRRVLGVAAVVGVVTVRFTVAGGEVRVPSETTATHARMCRCEQLVPPIQPLG
jgi:hypothetical protein